MLCVGALGKDFLCYDKDVTDDDFVDVLEYADEAIAPWLNAGMHFKEGESLLNDGSAVVLFTWVRNVIGYDHATLPPEWMRGEGEGDQTNHHPVVDRFGGGFVFQSRCAVIGNAAKADCWFNHSMIADSQLKIGCACC